MTSVIFEKLLFDYAPFYETPEDVTLDNPYFKYFLLETAFNCDQREWGLDFMRYYWGSVPQEGATTWRSLCNQNAGNTGHGCHCTGAALSPNYFLIREVVGTVENDIQDAEGRRTLDLGYPLPGNATTGFVRFVVRGN